MLLSSADVANAGPFRDFFRALRSAIAHPDETPRPHRSSRSSHKHNETPPTDAPNSEASATAVPAPPGGDNVRMAKAASGTNQQKADLPHGRPVPGKPGLVTRPFRPHPGFRNVIGFRPRTHSKTPSHPQTYPYSVIR